MYVKGVNKKPLESDTSRKHRELPEGHRGMETTRNADSRIKPFIISNERITDWHPKKLEAGVEEKSGSSMT